MADGEHPSRETLRRFLDREADRPETATVFAHLLAQCEECGTDLAALAGPPPPEEDYREAVARSLAACRTRFATLHQARTEVRRRFRGPAAGPAAPTAPDIPAGTVARPELAWAWCELLLEAVETCRGAAGDVDVARLAVHAADRLSGGPFPAAQLADLRARAWAELGNLERAADRLDLAEEALGTALDHLAAGSGDELLLAFVLDLHGSLYRDQRRFAEAVRAIDRAAHLYVENGEHQRAARALVSKGLTLVYAEQPERALEALTAALAWLDPAADTRLVLAAVHNSVLALADAAQFQRAARLLPSFRLLHQALGSRLDRARLSQVEGRIAAGLGRCAEAERRFRASRAGFAEAGQDYDVALVGLDLADLLLTAGRPAEVVQLVDEMLGSFHQRGILREACASLLLLRRAVEQGEATAALLRTLTRQIRDGEALGAAH